jgi:hypothetical protein
MRKSKKEKDMELIGERIAEMTALLKTIQAAIAEDEQIISRAKEAKERVAQHKKEVAAVTSQLNCLKWEWMDLNWADMPTEESND